MGVLDQGIWACFFEGDRAIEAPSHGGVERRHRRDCSRQQGENCRASPLNARPLTCAQCLSRRLGCARMHEARKSFRSVTKVGSLRRGWGSSNSSLPFSSRRRLERAEAAPSTWCSAPATASAFPPFKPSRAGLFPCAPFQKAGRGVVTIVTRGVPKVLRERWDSSVKENIFY